MHELRPGDVRPGNFVFFDGEVDMITGTNMDDSGYCQRNGHFNFDKGRVEAIPLTSEWLERCGFPPGEYTHYDGSKSDRDTYIHKSKQGTFLITLFPIGLIGNEYEFYGMQYFLYPQSQSVLPPQLLYVHQLQNLYFALTGQELQIKL